MADWNLPGLTDLYVNVLAYLKGRLNDAVMMLDSALNLPTGAKRWNSASKNWDAWSGNAWVAMADSYNINISGNAATATTSAACSGNAATATTSAACSGNAATATNASYATSAGTAAACSGNAATATHATSADSATTAGTCSGNAATATTAAAVPWSGVTGKPTNFVTGVSATRLVSIGTDVGYGADLLSYGLEMAGDGTIRFLETFQYRVTPR